MKTSIMFGRLVILVVWLTMALPTNLFGAEFVTDDLAGTWYWYAFADSQPSSANHPVWSRGIMTMDSSGTITSGTGEDSDGGVSTSGGYFSLSTNGEISGSFIRNQGGINHTSSITQGKMDVNKTMVSFVFTDDGGYRNVVIAVKDGGSFATIDLAGTWYGYVFADSDPNSANYPVWSRGTVTMDSSGTVTGGGWVDSDGSSSTITGGSFSLSTDGVMSGSFTINGHPSSFSQGKMDVNKAMASFVFTDDGGFRNVVIVLRDGGTFTTADSAGTWYWYAFADSDPSSANHPVWSRSIMTINSSGTITGGAAEDSDGGSSSSGGKFSLSSNGGISGSFTRNQGGINHTSSITQGKMDASKTMASFVFTDDGGFRNVVIAIKDTPLAMNISSLPAGEVGAQYDAGLGVSGGEAPYSLSVTKGSLPSGLSFFGEDLVGTPTVGGKRTFTINVTDQHGASASRKYTLTINKAILLSTSTLKAGTAGRGYSATLKATNGQKPYTWSIVSGALPAGLGFNGSTGTISGVPVSAGSAAITFQVNDPSGGKAQKTLTLTIK